MNTNDMVYMKLGDSKVVSGENFAAKTDDDYTTIIGINNSIKSEVIANGKGATAFNDGIDAISTGVGQFSTAITTAGNSTAIADGEKSIAVSLGCNGKARGVIGSWLILAEWNDNWERENVGMFYVDGDKIKPNIFYTMKNGKAVNAANLI